MAVLRFFTSRAKYIRLGCTAAVINAGFQTGRISMIVIGTILMFHAWDEVY